MQIGDSLNIRTNRECNSLLKPNETYTIQYLNSGFVQVREIPGMWFPDSNFVTVLELRKLKLEKILKL